MKIKILCLNCFGVPLSFNKKIRFDLIANEILTSKPDIVMLQEVVFASERRILQEKFKGSDYNLFPNNNKNFSDGGLIILVRNLTVGNYFFEKFKDQGPLFVLSLTDRILGKGFQWTKIKLGKHNVNFINTHLLCKYRETENDSKSFKNQINELVSFIKNHVNGPLILGGDINTKPDSSELIFIKDNLNLKDYLSDLAFTVHSDNLNRGKLMNIFGDGKAYRTDYILFDSSIKVRNESIVFDKAIRYGNKKINLSDHFGILAEIEV